MLNLTVPDMSCGHCVKAITAAVKTLDANAIVETDLESRKVSLETTAGIEAIKHALTEAGYPPA
ncbi:MAG: heavy-metal-associated domain-containing protein [Gammaproteobacteria bacterium]|nr:heavy-metal-associated domain-containing protein [Gammaproteobacteria bacterium]